jgi:hypothetical protein
MSRFIQNYNQHLTAAEESDDVLVLEQRSDRPTWILETEHRAHATSEATGFLALALSAVARDSSLADKFADALVEALPWVRFLPDSDRATFIEEATDMLHACASLGRYTAFADLIEEWKATAEIWSDPELAQHLSEDVSTPLDIPVP